MEKRYLKQAEFARLCKVSRQAICKAIKHNRVILNNKRIDLYNHINIDYLTLQITPKRIKTPEEIEAHQKLYYITHKEERKEYYQNNKEKYRAYNKKYYGKYPEKDKKYRETHREEKRASDKHKIDIISDSYVKQQIKNATGLPISLIPSDMIEIKRMIINIRRVLLERKTVPTV